MADRMQKLTEGFRRELLNGCGFGEIICIDGKAECGTVLANGRNPEIELKTNQRALRYGVEDWPIESMHWGLDYNLLQDRIKRKSGKSAHNLICQLFIFK